METETQSLKEVANEALVGLINGVTEAAQFLKGEIPIAVKELLTYYTAYHWLMLAVNLLLCAGMVFGAWRWFKFLTRGKSEWLDTPACIPNGMLALGAIFPALNAVFYELPALLKITLAPRIWLIEYAANLVK